MQTATADPLVGRVLEGRYRIRARIARGGMSTVYSAVDERLDRVVAVKVMAGPLSADPAFADRFAREAQAAAKLSHVNAVSVYDQGVDETAGGACVFLVMELVRGRTLRDLIRERGALTPAEAVSLVEPVLSALAAAHRAGLVHRDIKPENILLADDGVVKVADFGLARAVESDPVSTRTGLMMGTVAYCSPEQISRGTADQRSDVYSTGIVLFELLTGEAPYVGESAMAVAWQHVHSRVPAPSSRAGHRVPERLDDLVVRATDSDPSARPLDAGAFLAELHDVRVDLALPVLPVPPRPRAATPVPQFATTDRLGPGPAAHDTRLAEPLAAPSPTGLGPARPSIPRPPAAAPPTATGGAPRRRKRRRGPLIALVIVLLLGAAAGYAGWWFAAGRYKHVPDVGGEPRSTALAALHNAGFDHITVRRAYSETVAKDRVIDTAPASGTRLLPKHAITVQVSLGKQRCALPKVSGSEAQAKAALAACKFPLHVVATQQSSDTVPKGTVLGTDPPAGTAVKPGQAVTIVVSSGPPVLAVPDVTGHAQGVATDTLQSAGFKVGVATAYSDTVPEGDVIAQTPAGSSSAVKFSTVTITVSQGPPLVTIPQIHYLAPIDEVKAQLESLGLKVKVKKPFGGSSRVVGIDPPAGTQVRKGHTVTIYVV